MKTLPFALFLVFPLLSRGQSSLLDQLSAPQITEAIEKIRTNTLPGKTLDANEFERARLQGLLARLGNSARLVSLDAAAVAKPVEAFRAEMLPRSITYLRLGDLSAENLASLSAELKKPSAPAAVILDLRATRQGSSYELAAQLINVFAAPITPYFQMQKGSGAEQQSFGGSQPAQFQGLLAILINEDCSGPAETIAACLRQQARAVIIGTPGAGRAMEYQTFALGEQAAIEVAVGRIVLPKNGPDLTKGLSPDIAVKVPVANERKILTASVREGLGKYIFEVEHPHMSEASLVANRNPEIDLYQERQARGDAPEEQPLLDRTLQRALDTLTTVLVSRTPVAGP